jgi:hypothetical protein
VKVSREPAVWVGIIGSILVAAASLELSWLNAGQAAAIVAFISAAVMAVFTRPVAPALFVAGFSALVAVFAEYGLKWSDAQVGAITAFILGAFALFGVRPQVNPTDSKGNVVPGQVMSNATVVR